MRGIPLDWDGEVVQSRYVLGACYKGKSVSERTLLTHLVYVNVYDSGNSNDIATGCREPLDNMADRFSNLVENDKRPTCKTCAKKWDKIKGRI